MRACFNYPSFCGFGFVNKIRKALNLTEKTDVLTLKQTMCPTNMFSQIVIDKINK